RQYEVPLKVMLVLGEETGDMVARKLNFEIAGGLEHYKTADEAGRVALVSWIEHSMRQAKPEKLFADTGALTDSGKQLWKSIIEWRPDFVMFDTLSSLSD